MMESHNIDDALKAIRKDKHLNKVFSNMHHYRLVSIAKGVHCSIFGLEIVAMISDASKE